MIDVVSEFFRTCRFVNKEKKTNYRYGRVPDIKINLFISSIRKNRYFSFHVFIYRVKYSEKHRLRDVYIFFFLEGELCECILCYTRDVDRVLSEVDLWKCRYRPYYSTFNARNHGIW